MKQEERTQRTQERILAAALEEFGEKGYEAASINAICGKSQVPKGLLYHNFQGKDDLYLRCVGLCCRQTTAYLSAQAPAGRGAREDAKALLARRQRFFREHPHHANLFFHALLQPPGHLLPQLKEARREFDAFCLDRYRRIVAGLSLCGRGSRRRGR